MDTPREPDVSSCVNAFLAAREWVSMMKAPATSDEASAISLPGVRGIAVMLRFEGRVIGGGEDWPGGVGDDRMLRRAVARAIAEAMGDDLIRNLDPVLRDSSGQRLSIEIDFAGRPEPLLGRTFDDCASRIDRGLDGIALRRGYPGSISWHVAFPSHLIASNTARSPRGTIERLVRESGLPPKDLDELSRIEPIGIFRFVSFRLAQSSPTAPPQPRGRGVSRVIDGEVTRASVVSHAMGILRRFSRALPPEEGNEAMPKGIGLFGNYSPVRDSYEPLIAPPQDQAFVAWAAAAVAVSPSFTDADRAEARALSLRVLRDFIETTPTESRPLDTVPAMAGVVCAIELLIQTPDSDGMPPPEDLLETARLAREKLTERLMRGNNINERALASLAAAMTVGTERRMVLAAELRKLLVSLWGLPKQDSSRDSSRDQFISILPWLVLSDTHYARATGEPSVHTTEAHAAMRLLLLVQAGFSELVSETDLRGGFRLNGERRAGVTSQSLRPGLALAGMLAHGGFMPAETPEDIQTIATFRERLVALLRFSQELTMTGDLPLFFRNPKRVEGGVREALWDSDQSVPANAMAVLVDVTALQTDLWAPLPKPAAVPEAATTSSEPEHAAKDGETVPETPETPSRHE
ncbi:MAG: hypothetical protein JNL80_04490 [Phycisphaerae bacterium]|jgi:hypothetical protein|nr:hypothetical protein [Phycisphaerae bacterium]